MSLQTYYQKVSKPKISTDTRDGLFTVYDIDNEDFLFYDTEIIGAALNWSHTFNGKCVFTEEYLRELYNKHYENGELLDDFLKQLIVVPVITGDDSYFDLRFEFGTMLIEWLQYDEQ